LRATPTRAPSTTRSAGTGLMVFIRLLDEWRKAGMLPELEATHAA
jgi:hypothetical protein